MSCVFDCFAPVVIMEEIISRPFQSLLPNRIHRKFLPGWQRQNVLKVSASILIAKALSNRLVGSEYYLGEPSIDDKDISLTFGVDTRDPR